MTDRPTLYWISGSPPAWRVMLGLTLKGVAWDSRRLDHGAGENKEPAYLALNPKGQVPTLVLGDLVIRESIALLAWMDREWPERSIWGDTSDEAAAVWQDVMVMEGDLRPVVTATAQGLIRGHALPDGTLDTLTGQMNALDARLADARFLGGAAPMAADCWLYPAIGWIARCVQLAGVDAPDTTRTLTTSRPALAAWRDRMAALPGVADTHPPHWRD